MMMMMMINFDLFLLLNFLHAHDFQFVTVITTYLVSFILSNNVLLLYIAVLCCTLVIRLGNCDIMDNIKLKRVLSTCYIEDKLPY